MEQCTEIVVWAQSSRSYLLVGVLAGEIGFHRCYHLVRLWLGWFRLNCACCLSIANTTIESVDLLHVHIAEAVPLTEPALAFLLFFLNGRTTVLKRNTSS